MKVHRHRVKIWRNHPFDGPVVPPDRQVPKAHGGLLRYEICACGAVRRSAVNGAAIERGPWMEPA